MVEPAEESAAMSLSSSNIYLNFAVGFLIGGLAVVLNNPELSATLSSVVA